MVLVIVASAVVLSSCSDAEPCSDVLPSWLVEVDGEFAAVEGGQLRRLHGSELDLLYRCGLL